MEDLRQSLGWRGYLKDKGWKVVDLHSEDMRHKMQAFIVPLGLFNLTMLKLQRAEYDPNWKELKQIKRKYKVVSSVIEPLRVQDELAYKMAGYHLTRFPYLATKTFMIDLQKSEEELWHGLSENARRQILKNKETIIEDVSIEEFFPYWRKNSKIWTMKKEELQKLLKRFKGKARLVMSQNKEGVHSGLLIIWTNDTANYYQTWTSETGRLSGAHYKLVWEEIRRAKKAGLKYFDLEGIFDERWPQKRWVGFTEFKRRFGGKVVEFPGSFFRWL